MTDTKLRPYKEVLFREIIPWLERWEVTIIKMMSEDEYKWAMRELNKFILNLEWIWNLRNYNRVDKSLSIKKKKYWLKNRKVKDIFLEDFFDWLWINIDNLANELNKQELKYLIDKFKEIKERFKGLWLVFHGDLDDSS